jgi:hypothetical protein
MKGAGYNAVYFELYFKTLSKIANMAEQLKQTLDGMLSVLGLDTVKLK